MNIKLLFIIILILFFLNSFCFGIGNFFIAVFIPFMLLLITILLIADGKGVLKKIIRAYKHTPVKYFIWFFCWSIITIIVSIVTKNFSFEGFITGFVGGLLLSVLAPYILVSYGVKRILSLKNIIKFLLIMFFAIFLLGIVDFIAFYFHIKCLESLVGFLINRRSIIFNADFSKVGTWGFARVQSIFEEPSYLAYFILISSPILYKLCLSKNKIFDNKLMDLFLKRSTIVLALLDLILTQSPIFLVFAGIVLFVFLIHKGIKINFSKFLLQISFVMAIIILFIFISNNFYDYLPMFNLNLENTYIIRIIKTINNMNSLNLLIIVEPSLATRIICYINTFIIGMKNFIFGVGYGNLGHIIRAQLMNSPVPLTQELINNYIQKDMSAPPSAIFYRIFAETGLIGVLLFYNFLFQNIKFIDKIKTSFSLLEQELLIGLKYYVYFLMIFSFYASNINSVFIFIYLGLISGMILIAKDDKH